MMQLQSSPFQSRRHLAMAYTQVGVLTGVEGASRHRLVALLFEGYMEALTRARGAYANGQLESKGKLIGKAARIIEEGLKAALNLKDGGTLAQDLHDLYAYVTVRLTLANVRNDMSMLDECQRLIAPLQEAWADIRPQVEEGALQ